MDCTEEHARRMGVEEYLGKKNDRKVLRSRSYKDQKSAAYVVDLFGAYLYHNWEYISDDDAAKEIKKLTLSQLKEKVLDELKFLKKTKTVLVRKEDGSFVNKVIPYVLSLSLSLSLSAS